MGTLVASTGMLACISAVGDIDDAATMFPQYTQFILLLSFVHSIYNAVTVLPHTDGLRALILFGALLRGTNIHRRPWNHTSL